MRKKILLVVLSFLSFSLFSFSQTKKPELLEEIDYFRIYYEGDPNKIITVQNVETDWGKLGLKGYVKKMKSYYVRGGVEADIEYFYFNTDGSLIKFEGEELNKITKKKVPVVIDYIYNDKGQAIQIIENKGGKKQIKNIQYSGDIPVSAIYHKNGMIARYGRDTYVFIYNEKGQIIEVQDSEEKMRTPHYFEYNANGKCIKETYNHKGPLISVQNGKKISNETCYIFKYAYNNVGDLISKDDSESHNIEKNIIMLTFNNNYFDNFSYDDNGNWISSTYKKREFIYYTDADLKESNIPVPEYPTDSIDPPRLPLPPPGGGTTDIHKVQLSCEDKKYGISDNTPIFWNGKVSESFQTGEGTVESPYIIALPSQLAYLAKCVNDGNTFEDKYFVLVNDLDLGGRGQAKHPWVPIGSAKGTYFGGHFYGNNRTIYNMHRTTSGESSCAGLFGTIGKTAIVSEIIIDRTGSLKGWVVGGIAAYNEGYIEACRSSVRCEGSDIGGIVGINKGVINNCISNASLQSPMYTAGGISAKNGGIISQCTYKGNIVFIVTSKYCGGITGEMLDIGTVADCYNIGNISTESFSLRTGIGGLVGSKNLKDLSSTSIKNSYSAGTGSGSHIIPDYKKNIENISNCFFDIDIKILGKSENKELFWFEQNGARSTVNMKGEGIISSLNQGNNVWLKDINNINKGYPILSIENNNKSRFVECKSTISVNPVTGRKPKSN